MSNSDTISAITEFMASSFEGAKIPVDQDIFEAGYGNSMFAMQLVSFVESRFGIEIDGDDLSIDNFRSVERVASLVERKQKSAAA